MAFIFLSGTESYRRYAKWTSAGGVHGQGVSFLLGCAFVLITEVLIAEEYHREKLKCFAESHMAGNFGGRGGGNGKRIMNIQHCCLTLFEIIGCSYFIILPSK